MNYNFTHTKKQAIKKALGYGYVKEIKKFLDKHNVTNAKNQPFSEANIRVLFNKQTTNLEFFSKVLELYSIKKKEKKSLENKLKNVS